MKQRLCTKLPCKERGPTRQLCTMHHALTRMDLAHLRCFCFFRGEGGGGGNTSAVGNQRCPRCAQAQSAPLQSSPLSQAAHTLLATLLPRSLQNALSSAPAHALRFLRGAWHAVARTAPACTNLGSPGLLMRPLQRALPCAAAGASGAAAPARPPDGGVRGCGPRTGRRAVGLRLAGTAGRDPGQQRRRPRRQRVPPS